MRFDNGYKPFFIDLSYDGCKFIKDQGKNPIAQMFFQTFMNSTNLNHSCPFNVSQLDSLYKVIYEFLTKIIYSTIL